jgi:integrase
MGPYLFPSEVPENGYQKSFKKVWRLTLKRAKVGYFRLYDLQSTYATRLSPGGVASTGDAKVFKKYSQMKREALAKINRKANETGSGTVRPN